MGDTSVMKVMSANRRTEKWDKNIGFGHSRRYANLGKSGAGQR
jgi:hypothetical protein